MSRRGVRWVAPPFIACSFFACNALLDNEPVRTVDDGREAGVDRQGTDSVQATGTEAGGDQTSTEIPPDGGDAATTITIDVPLSFITPNGAIFGPADGGGVAITGTNGANHPVIVPIQQPAIGTDDYTVEAVVRASADCEYGVMTRMLADAGGGQVLGSRYGTGGDPKPFIGNMGTPDWNPPADSTGQPYTFSAGRYRMRVQAKGPEIRGMMWKDGAPVPANWEVGDLTAAYPKGRGVGFYVYFCYSAVLESLKVTIP